MRSVSALVLLAVVLGGCATTQQRNDRAKLQAARLLAGRRAVLVTEHDPAIRLGRVELLHHRGAVAVVVELHNTSAVPLTDVPISVGLRSGPRRTYLNHRAGLPYFQTHVPAIAPGGDATWVFTTRRAPSLRGTPFAIAGAPASPPLSTARNLPGIVVRPQSGLATLLRLQVRNTTDVPQYDLQVYAFARRGTRYVAAGRTTLAHLGTRQTKDLALGLIGTTTGAALSLEAVPTIFQ